MKTANFADGIYAIQVRSRFLGLSRRVTHWSRCPTYLNPWLALMPLGSVLGFQRLSYFRLVRNAESTSAVRRAALQFTLVLCFFAQGTLDSARLPKSHLYLSPSSKLNPALPEQHAKTNTHTQLRHHGLLSRRLSRTGSSHVEHATTMLICSPIHQTLPELEDKRPLALSYFVTSSGLASLGPAHECR